MRTFISVALIFTCFTPSAYCQQSPLREKQLSFMEESEFQASSNIELLIKAIKKIDLEVVKSLIGKNPSLIYKTNSMGLAPIVACFEVEGGKIRSSKLWEIYQFLLEKDKVYKASFYPKKYPFHNAVATSNKIQISMLLSESSNSSIINSIDCYGDTPVDIALKTEDSRSSAILKLLKDSGGLSSKEMQAAKAEEELKAKQTAALLREKEIQEAKAAELAAKLKKEAELTAKYPDKYPLHQAILDYNKPKVLSLLAKKDISINEFDYWGQTPCDVTKKISDPGKGLEMFNLLKQHGGATSEEVKKFAESKDASADSNSTFWEYKTVFYSDMELIGISFETRMNNLGQEGWELISQRRAKASFPTDEWGVEAALKRKTVKKN